jgi:hypothetical protein
VQKAIWAIGNFHDSCILKVSLDEFNLHEVRRPLRCASPIPAKGSATARPCVRSETRTIYVARDKQEFFSEAACLAHEREIAADALIGLTRAKLEAALDGSDRDLAFAIETVARRIRANAKAASRPRRRPDGAGEPAPEPAP